MRDLWLRLQEHFAVQNNGSSLAGASIYREYDVFTDGNILRLLGRTDSRRSRRSTDVGCIVSATVLEAMHAELVARALEQLSCLFRKLINGSEFVAGSRLALATPLTPLALAE